MKQFLITLGGVLAGLVIFVVIAPIVLITLITASLRDTPAAASNAVLLVDLREPMTDQRPQNPFASLQGGLALLDVIAKIDAAREDASVHGLYVRANTDGMSGAQAEELRAAFAAFRQSGKFIIAHMQNDGVRQSMAGYMAVADADEVWLQDASELQAMGLSSEVSFFGDTLRRFRLQAQVEQREEYKSAMAPLTERGFTPAHREETMGLMNGLYAVMTQAIAQDRGLTQAALDAAIRETPMTGERAKDLKLIDQLGRPEDAERAALERAGRDAELVDIAAYRAPLHTGGPVIAVVTGEGAIVSGPEQQSLFGDGAVMNSDAVARALLDASEDDDVRAIVFRVSSPGGSVVGSDQILAALRTAKERGKRIVVSMGDVAASGGYYVAADADEIVADAATITGSIGVIGGKVVIGPALEYYGAVHTESASVGSPLITMFSSETPFSPAERAAFAGFIDRSYQDFLALVANGRRLTVAQVREVARGRVWTGEQAKQRQLVDHIGGFNVALARARALGGIDAGERVQLRYYPSQKTPFEQFQAMLGASSDSAEALIMLGALARDPQVMEALAAIRQRDASVRAEAPPIHIR